LLRWFFYFLLIIIILWKFRKGLGALNLGKKGINVVLTHFFKKDEDLAVVAEIEQMGPQAAVLQLDAGDVKSFDAFFIAFKEVLKNIFNADRFDFLINNAGTALYAPFSETTEEQFDKAMNI